jgi:hypothetical protein
LESQHTLWHLERQHNISTKFNAFALVILNRLILIEEQKLAPKEEVDMPVFFYIDPEFASDPWMKDVSEIVLHYTFFKSKNQV